MIIYAKLLYPYVWNSWSKFSLFSSCLPNKKITLTFSGKTLAQVCLIFDLSSAVFENTTINSVGLYELVHTSGGLNSNSN